MARLARLIAAYYNEIDPYAAQWLRNLIAAGHVAPGIVDERSIEEVHASEIRAFTQHHFFAGIGVWSYALRLAGWPDDRPVCTGSCPCQPFSSAGQRGGFADERHLWPDWFRVVAELGPATVFGEQVASPDGLAWLDLVQTDMEGAGYAFGAVDTCAAGFGAPHIRQRVYWAADNDAAGRGEQWGGGVRGDGEPSRGDDADGCSGADRGLADNQSDRWREGRRPIEERAGSGDDRGVGDSISAGLERLGGYGNRSDEPGRIAADPSRSVAAAGPVNGFWSDAVWLPCTDGKCRPAQPSAFPLAHGTPARVGRLRAYGNAIVAPQAAAFIAAYMACRPRWPRLTPAVRSFLPCHP